MEKKKWFPERRAAKPPDTVRTKAARTFADRWGSMIVFEGGYTVVPTSFLEHYTKLGVSTSEAMFFLQLMSFKWTTASPFPSYKKLSERMGIKVEAARRLAQRLEAKGLLARVPRKGTSNEFDVTLLTSALQAKVLQERKKKPAKTGAKVA